MSIRVEGLQDRDRVCALMIDEMSLKSNLSYDKLCDVIYGFMIVVKGLTDRKLCDKCSRFYGKRLIHELETACRLCADTFCMQR